jgi:hypothetical protein
MIVTIRGKNNDVHITGDFTGPFIDLTLSPEQAYNLYRRLQEKSSQLYDLATNYYECKECANMHHTSVKICPNREEHPNE